MMEVSEHSYEVVKKCFLIHWRYVADIPVASLELPANISGSYVAGTSVAYENQALVRLNQK